MQTIYTCLHKCVENLPGVGLLVRRRAASEHDREECFMRGTTLAGAALRAAVLRLRKHTYCIITKGYT